MEPCDASGGLDSSLLVATNAERVIQQGGGHVRSCKEDVRILLDEWHVHTFSSIGRNFREIKPGAPLSRMSLFYS